MTEKGAAMASLIRTYSDLRYSRAIPSRTNEEVPFGLLLPWRQFSAGWH